MIKDTLQNLKICGTHNIINDAMPLNIIVKINEIFEFKKKKKKKKKFLKNTKN